MVSLMSALAELEQLAACLACSGDDRVIARHCCDTAYSLLAEHGSLSAAFTSALIGKSSLANHYGSLSALCEHLAEALQSCTELLGSGGAVHDEIVYIHDLKELQGDPALIYVLRLVVNPGLSPPAYNEQHGYAIDLPAQQRSRRVYHVALTRILHIHHGHLSRCKVIACRQSRAAALICRDKVVVRIITPAVLKAAAKGL